MANLHTFRMVSLEFRQQPRLILFLAEGVQDGEHEHVHCGISGIFVTARRRAQVLGARDL